jgi:hypothetical protein
MTVTIGRRELLGDLAVWLPHGRSRQARSRSNWPGSVRSYLARRSSVISPILVRLARDR